MNANELLHYLRGFFELVAEPSKEQMIAIRNEVLNARPVEAQLIPVEVRNPIHTLTTTGTGGCGCKNGQQPPELPSEALKHLGIPRNSTV